MTTAAGLPSKIGLEACNQSVAEIRFYRLGEEITHADRKNISRGCFESKMGAYSIRILHGPQALANAGPLSQAPYARASNYGNPMYFFKFTTKQPSEIPMLVPVNIEEELSKKVDQYVTDGSSRFPESHLTYQEDLNNWIRMVDRAGAISV